MWIGQIFLQKLTSDNNIKFNIIILFHIQKPKRFAIFVPLKISFKGVCQHFDTKELELIAHKIRYYMKIHGKRKPR